jgi:hypothetical protein
MWRSNCLSYFSAFLVAGISDAATMVDFSRYIYSVGRLPDAARRR